MEWQTVDGRLDVTLRQTIPAIMSKLQTRGLDEQDQYPAGKAAPFVALGSLSDI